MRTFVAVLLGGLAPQASLADDALYRYEGDVHPLDESAGWLLGNACEAPCSEAIEEGRFILRWTRPSDLVNYDLAIPAPGEPPPSTLWVEWRFRSNRPLGPNFYTCDANFRVQYASTFEVVFMYGDAAISFSGDDFIGELNIDELHTYRFESLDGEDYWIAVDGKVFIVGFDNIPRTAHSIALRGGGGCDRPELATVNEWDFVRYGTISYGEQIVGSDPPQGFVDAREHAGLDRFTVTFDSPNYVYLDVVTVDVTGGVASVVTQTRRRDNDEPDTVEIVLDRPIARGETTRFTFDDGLAVNMIEYTFAPGDTDGDGDADLRDIAASQRCFSLVSPTGPCWTLDANEDEHIDHTDHAALVSSLTGP